MSNLIDFIREAPVNKLLGLTNRGSEVFQFIQQEKIQSKEKLVEQFYDGAIPESSLYELLGSIESDVVNSIICSPPSQSGLRAHYEYVQRMECATKILERQGKNKQAVYLAEKALKKSLLYEFTGITLSLAETCSYYFGIIGNRKKFEYYQQLYEESLELFTYKKKVEALHIQLMFAIASKKSSTLEDEQLAKECFEEITQIKHKCQSNRITTLWGICGVTYYLMKNDHPQIIQICKEALAELLPQADQVYVAWIFAFLIHMIPSQVKAKQTQEALDYLERCEEAIGRQAYNNNLVQQYKVIVVMHNLQPERAAMALEKIRAQKLNELQQEIYEIHYSYFALLTGKQFRLARFLNQVPVYSKDKEGMNLNMLIIPLLYFLREKNFTKFIDRTPGILRYTHRHLKKTKAKRSLYFIRSLLELEKIAFDPCKLDQIKSIRKLKDFPYHKSTQDFDVEIVPYEYLWEEIQQWLIA